MVIIIIINIIIIIIIIIIIGLEIANYLSYNLTLLIKRNFIFNLPFLSFTKLNVVKQKPRGIGHPVRIEITKNLSRSLLYYTGRLLKIMSLGEIIWNKAVSVGNLVRIKITKSLVIGACYEIFSRC